MKKNIIPVSILIDLHHMSSLCLKLNKEIANGNFNENIFEEIKFRISKIDQSKKNILKKNNNNYT